MMKKVPKRRFKGFLNAGDWEQRKLGEITERYENLRVPITANLRIPGNTPYYGANGIQDYVEGHTHEGEFVLVAEDGANDLKNYPVQFVNGRIWVNNHAHVLQGKKDIIDNHFLAYAIRRTNMGSLLVGGSRPKLNAETLMKIAISVPEIEEQRMVGTQLNQFDNLITLHQRKLEKLQATKKALLYELFPIENSRRPKRRFKGFTDDWEQRKLGEIASINPRTELPNSFKYVDLESVIGTNLIGCKKIEKENAPSRAQRLASFGDIFYQTVRPYQRNNYLFEKDDDDVVFSTGYAQLRSELDSYFLFTLIQTDSFVRKVLDNCTGTSYPAINSSELGKILISVPQDKLESHQIGTVFRILDNVITLHQ